jgi:RimJ/RimL family protein N-acetyltransferase
MSIERFELANRETVPDELMHAYRTIMASIWFPNDEPAQRKYMDLPGQAPMGNVTESLCLVDNDRVIGTAALYGFSSIRNRDRLTNSERLENLPSWLTETIYRGDLSVVPEFQGQGLASQLVDQLKSRAFDQSQSVVPNRIIGITEATNDGMLRVVHNSGGNVVSPEDYHFIKLPNSIRPRFLKQSSKFTVQPYYLDKQHPPVIHLFYDDRNEIQAGTIATSPNVPGETLARSTGNIDDLFPNQCVGFINPGLSRRKMRMILPTIYNAVSRYKYISLFQRKNNDGMYAGNNVLKNGFKDGWTLYEYSK